MTAPWRRAGAAGLLGLALLIAGCGTASHDNGAGQAGAPQPISLSTTITTAGGTWAVAVAGGSAARHNNFWQLLVRPAASGTWRLATPPGVASNGGLVIAPSGPAALTAAFRPSQGLVFTPLASTADLGGRWSAGVLDADLASTPAALAGDPANGHMLALLADGTVEQSGDRGATWSPLTSLRAVGRSQPGRRCDLRDLTAVGFSRSGAPLLAGTCARSGIVPVFALTGQAWQAAGPSLPAAQASRPLSVLTMTTVAGRSVALLQTGAGQASTLTAAWSAASRAGGTGGWQLSPALPLRGQSVQSASVGSNGSVAVLLSGRAGLVLSSPGTAWQPLPKLPPATQALAIGPGATIQALAPIGSTVTIWADTQPGGNWTAVQHMAIPIQYGSSS
jgi:hypothetical protein